MNKELTLLESLSHYYFQFGIFDGEGQQVIDVNILNTDDTITLQKMRVRDVMYFTENGTITIPGQRILERSLIFVNNLLTNELSLIVDKIFLGNITKSEIENNFREIAIKIQDYVRNYMFSIIKRNNTLGSIINEDVDSNKYIYNLDDLRKYVKCAVFKK